MKTFLTGLLTIFISSASYESFASDIQGDREDLSTKIAKAHVLFDQLGLSEHEREQQLKIIKEEDAKELYRLYNGSTPPLEKRASSHTTTPVNAIFTSGASYESSASGIHREREDLSTKIENARALFDQLGLSEHEREQQLKIIREEDAKELFSLYNGSTPPVEERASSHTTISINTASHPSVEAVASGSTTSTSNAPNTPVEEIVQNNTIQLISAQTDTTFANQFSPLVHLLAQDVREIIGCKSPKYSFVHWLAWGVNADKMFDVNRWEQFQKKSGAWDIGDVNLLAGSEQIKITSAILRLDFLTKYGKDIRELKEKAGSLTQLSDRSQLIRSLAPARTPSQGDDLAYYIGSSAQLLRRNLRR